MYTRSETAGEKKKVRTLKRYESILSSDDVKNNCRNSWSRFVTAAALCIVIITSEEKKTVKVEISHDFGLLHFCYI